MEIQETSMSAPSWKDSLAPMEDLDLVLILVNWTSVKLATMEVQETLMSALSWRDSLAPMEDLGLALTSHPCSMESVHLAQVEVGNLVALTFLLSFHLSVEDKCCIILDVGIVTCSLKWMFPSHLKISELVLYMFFVIFAKLISEWIANRNILELDLSVSWLFSVFIAETIKTKRFVIRWPVYSSPPSEE